MGKRVSHSVLDPWISPPLKGLYRRLPIPSALPPEAIVGLGHLLAVATPHFPLHAPEEDIRRRLLRPARTAAPTAN